MQLHLPMGSEAKGVVYTKPWVVDLILDLVGYRAEVDLAELRLVEPAAGEGAFLLPVVRRLVSSIRTHGRTWADAKGAILAYELDRDAAAWARQLVVGQLTASDVPRRDAIGLARRWVVNADYLLSSPTAPPADVIVGNPPYIRYDDIPEALFAAYRELCPTMVGRCDIYVGFIEAGLRQLHPGGRLGFICADRWMRAAYGSELRRLVAATASVDAVIEMHNADAFDDEVSAYPAVTILRSGSQGSVLVGSGDKAAGPLASEESLADALVASVDDRSDPIPGFTMAQLDSWYAGDSPWPWGEPRALALLKQLEARCSPLEGASTGTKIGIGVATGADKVFITRDASLVEAERMLPLAMAQDTRTGQLEWSGHYLVDPWSEEGLVELDDFPRLRTYFEEHADALHGRNIAKRNPNGWYRTIDRVTHSLQGNPKLLFPDMKMQAHPVLDTGQTYPHHNLYFLTSEAWDLEVLGGLLLSAVAELFVSSYCVKMRGGTLRFQAQYLRRIRVPDPSALDDSLAEWLREAFRNRDRDAATAAAEVAYGLPTGTMATL